MSSNTHYKLKPIKYKKCISYTYKKNFKLYYFYKNYIYIHICFVYSLEKLINIEKHTLKTNKHRFTENPGRTSSLRACRCQSPKVRPIVINI